MSGHDKQDNYNEARRSPPVIGFDYEAYAPYLEGTEYSEEQKRELLEALWSLICEFVAMGFEVHPIQQAENACGKLPKARTNPPIFDEGGVKCEDQSFDNKFNVAAGADAELAADRIQT